MHVLCAFVLTLSLAAPALAAQERSSQKREPSPKEKPASAEHLLVNEMLRHLGVRYRWGGSGPSGVDCSGYVRLVYRNAYGLALPHHSATLYASSDLEKISLDELETGDLLFFSSSGKKKAINHVGIYLSDGKFVHATAGKGVIVSSLDQQYYRRRIAGARRVLDEPESGSVSLELPQGLQLSLFRDSLFSFKGVEVPPRDDPVGLEGPSLSAHANGVGLRRDIRPFPWLVVTPSFSCYDYEGDLDESGLPRSSIGLDLSLVSKEDKWRISTQAYATPERASRGVDMSLRYSRRLSEGLSFSLLGERLQRYEAPIFEPGQHERMSTDQRVSILFNFAY